MKSVIFENPKFGISNMFKSVIYALWRIKSFQDYIKDHIGHNELYKELNILCKKFNDRD